MPDGSSSKRLSYEELRELNAELERQARQISSGRGAPQETRGRFRMRSMIGRLLLFAAAMILPFLVLVRTSVFVYSEYAVGGWLALAAGAAGTLLLLTGYLVYASLRFRSWKWLNKYAQRGVLLLVIAYCGYSLLYISNLNTKSDGVRSYYRSLHPVMRVAVTTASLAGTDLVVTDIRRSEEDYREMGLTPRHRSMHYVQDTGYVHAVDLRTLGRAEWKNAAVQWLFKLLGFETLRHTGTADHLHVYLPLNDS